MEPLRKSKLSPESKLKPPATPTGISKARGTGWEGPWERWWEGAVLCWAVSGVTAVRSWDAPVPGVCCASTATLAEQSQAGAEHPYWNLKMAFSG